MLSSIRNFFLTLLASLILLGLVGYLITDFALGAMNPTDKTQTLPSESQTEPQGDSPLPDSQKEYNYGESFAALLIGHDYQPTRFDDYDLAGKTDEWGFPLPERQINADTIIVVCFDQSSRTTFFCPIPSNTQIKDRGLTKTLGSLYGQYGPEYLTDVVASLIGMPIQCYASVGINELSLLVDRIGGIDYYVPSNIYYQGQILLERGNQTLSGEDTLHLIRYNGYGDSGEARRETAVSVLKKIFSKITTDSTYRSQAIAIFNDISRYILTDVTPEFIAKKLDLVFGYSEMTARSAAYPGTIRVDGTGEDAVTWFVPNTTAAHALFASYKFKG